MVITLATFLTRAFNSGILLNVPAYWSYLLHLIKQYRLLWKAAAYVQFFCQWFCNSNLYLFFKISSLSRGTLHIQNFPVYLFFVYFWSFESQTFLFLLQYYSLFLLHYFVLLVLPQLCFSWSWRFPLLRRHLWLMLFSYFLTRHHLRLMIFSCSDVRKTPCFLSKSLEILVACLCPHFCHYLTRY